MSLSVSLQIPAIFDPGQLSRIESVHRGFLYQHLYAAGCLLLAPTSGAVGLLVERDEDIELLFDSRHFYIQVKTRSRPLRMSDISGALSRFDELRRAHCSGQRTRSPQFWIVSNAAPGPNLLKQIDSHEWSSDVSLLWPGRVQNSITHMPPAWTNLTEAIQWCVDRAQTVPFSRLSGEALTWKLAARVQYACTGAPPQQLHQFSMEDLPDLFEQVTIELQEFPIPPTPYRPQELEPELQSENAVRLIVGFSGAGKTAWASQAAMHSGTAVKYYDAAAIHGPALASSLVRELAGRFFDQTREELGSVLLPGATGLESLRALDLILAKKGMQITVVIDNAHRIPPSEFRSVIRTTPTIRYILLAQPWPAQSELEALLVIQAEELKGWSIDTIAAEFSETGCPIDPAASSRIMQLTGGLPLYVQNAAHLTRKYYEGNADRFCSDVEAQSHITTTTQEVILSRVLDALTMNARDAAALVSLSDVPLTQEEACSLLIEPLGIERDVACRALRELASSGVVQQLLNRRLLIHDAFRLIAAGHRATMGRKAVNAARLALRTLLLDSMPEHDLGRIRLFLRLLPDTGEIKTLVDMSTDEFFHELGLAGEIESTLETASSFESLSPQDRFWALDTLALLDYQNSDLAEMAQRLSQMEALLPAMSDGRREKLSLIMKRMVLDAKNRDVASVRRLFYETYDDCHNDPQLQRILRYNFALSLYHGGSYSESEIEAANLIQEYYDVLGLSLEDVVAENPPEIAEKLANTSSQQDDLKHLADSLDLLAKAREAQHEGSGLARLHALKFYDMAQAVRSFIRVGQDVVDEYLGILHDPDAARAFIEQSLLPTIERYKLLDHIVPVGAQYAVVLAYCGDAEAAIAKMERLAAFVDAMPDDRQEEFENQRCLIEEIAGGRIQLGAKTESAPKSAAKLIQGQAKRKIGRNEPCPCGSGKKYKRCHGRKGEKQH